MRRVTVGALGRNQETTLKKAFAVNALTIVGYDFPFRPFVPDRGFLAFPMTATAEIRNIGREDR